MCVVVVVVVFYTCGGTSSRSRWLFLPGASSTLCWDTVLPPRCHHPHLPLALSSGSLHWRGQGSPVTSTKKNSTKTTRRWVSWALSYVSESMRMNSLSLSYTHTYTHTHAWFDEAKKGSQIYKHPGFCLSAGQACLPSILWELLLTLLCNVVACSKPTKSWHDNSWVARQQLVSAVWARRLQMWR